MGREAGPRSPEQAILLLRTIGVSLGLGVTLFAAVSWYLHHQESPVGAVAYGSLNYNAAIGLAFLAALGAFLAWRWRVAPILERAASEAEWQSRAGRIQTAVIITWALLEAGAMVDEVIYFLTGDGMAGLVGVALIWTGIGLTWPKASWLQA